MELMPRARSGIVTTLVTILLLCSAFAANAQDSFPPKELKFQNGFGTRKGDHRIYVLTGCCWIRGISFGNPDQFVTTWLAQHPAATLTPVSSMLIKEDELVFVWIADRDASLNVDLVRTGIYPGAALADMVDNEKGQTEALRNPKLADARAIVEKELAAHPEARPKRLEADDEYNRHLDLAKTVEAQAIKQKRGIWSDAMKEERQSIGLP